MVSIMICFLSPSGQAADINPGINNESQISKSLKFNEFFEKELTRSEKKLAFNEYYETYLAQRAQTVQERPELRYLIDLSIGHDRNTSFGPDRKGDFFQEQRFVTILDKLYVPHPLDSDQLLQFQPEGGLYWKDYFDENFLDAVVWSAGASIREKGNKPVSFSAKYLFNRIRYPSNAEITQSVHQASAAVTMIQNSSVEHQLHTLLEWKNYDERKSLEQNAVFSDESRKDFRYGFGYQFFSQVNNAASFYWNADWYRNDSNDIFLNYSDYESVSTSATGVIRISDRINQIFYGSFEYKEYDDRIFEFNSVKPQLDRIYAGGSLTEYRFTKTFSVIFSFRYIENTSTNVSQNYSGSDIKLTGRFLF